MYADRRPSPIATDAAHLTPVPFVRLFTLWPQYIDDLRQYFPHCPKCNHTTREFPVSPSNGADRGRYQTTVTRDGDLIGMIVVTGIARWQGDRQKTRRRHKRLRRLGTLPLRADAGPIDRHPPGL
ncbi:MAG: hypothetical protein ACYDEV_03240 [Acidiferrobacter sp.]